MFISYTRYIKIKNPLNCKANLKVQTFVAILISTFMGIFWSVTPTLGWSYYSLEGALISCSVEWHERTVSVLSYKIVITIFVYLVPLIVFIFTSMKIFYIV